MGSLKNLFYILLLLSFNLYGADDADFDGVDDSEDKCQNTPFSDLVDARGCSVYTLYRPMYYDFIIGYNYSTSNPNTLEDTTTTATTIQADISRADISLQLQSSYYKVDGSSDRGWNDTQLSLFYTMKPTPSLRIKAGAGVILPTYSSGYNNEEMDFSASLSLEYSLKENVDVFGGYSFTMINDKDVKGVTDYQNTSGFYAGLLLRSNQNISLHGFYSHTQSIYKEVSPIETLACGVIITLDTHWFTLIDYRHGVSESASEHEVSVRLGYTF
jgi:hypothetical protein